MPETVIKHHIWPLKVMFLNRKMPEAPDFDENRKSIFLTCKSKIVALHIVTKYKCNSFQAVGSHMFSVERHANLSPPPPTSIVPCDWGQVWVDLTGKSCSSCLQDQCYPSPGTVSDAISIFVRSKLIKVSLLRCKFLITLPLTHRASTLYQKTSICFSPTLVPVRNYLVGTVAQLCCSWLSSGK